jgi:hypothetical protein
MDLAVPRLRYWLEIPEDVLSSLGQLVVQWAHLDEAISSHLRILLGEPGARETIKPFPQHLRIPGKDRLALYRQLAKALFGEDEQIRISRALDKVANVRAHRERLIHGNITPQEGKQRLLVHYAEEKLDGRLRGENYWYTAHRIQIIAGQMAEADFELATAFLAHQLKSGSLYRPRPDDDG